mmetsp:Transcript_6992/g.16700  ORF Transcript_6992/g.16700 Transcript_6992/m.16700 type:complete len:210 (-) Transcript_6992:396-1025(-)
MLGHQAHHHVSHQQERRGCVELVSGFELLGSTLLTQLVLQDLTNSLVLLAGILRLGRSQIATANLGEGACAGLLVHCISRNSGHLEQDRRRTHSCSKHAYAPLQLGQLILLEAPTVLRSLQQRCTVHKISHPLVGLQNGDGPPQHFTQLGVRLLGLLVLLHILDESVQVVPAEFGHLHCDELGERWERGGIESGYPVLPTIEAETGGGK